MTGEFIILTAEQAAAVEGASIPGHVLKPIVYPVDTEKRMLPQRVLDDPAHASRRETLATIYGSAEDGQPLVEFGVCTDLHSANKASIARLGDDLFPRDMVHKLSRAVNEWNARDLSFVVCLGDLVDGLSGTTRTYAQQLTDVAAIKAEFDKAVAPRRYVMGNHDLDVMSKAQFLAAVGQASAYDSFDANGVHFVVLDANYRSNNNSDHYDTGNYSFKDTYIPPAQRTWLAADLAATALPTVVFCHQLLATTGDHEGWTAADLTVVNAAAVRSILEDSGKVLAVFNGHAHWNDALTVNGIRYFTMEAMGDTAFPANAYSVVRVFADGVSVIGFDKQSSYAKT